MDTGERGHRPNCRPVVDGTDGGGRLPRRSCPGPAPRLAVRVPAARRSCPDPHPGAERHLREGATADRCGADPDVLGGTGRRHPYDPGGVRISAATAGAARCNASCCRGAAPRDATTRGSRVAGVNGHCHPHLAGAAHVAGAECSRGTLCVAAANCDGEGYGRVHGNSDGDPHPRTYLDVGRRIHGRDEHERRAGEQHGAARGGPGRPWLRPKEKDPLVGPTPSPGKRVLSKYDHHPGSP